MSYYFNILPRSSTWQKIADTIDKNFNITYQELVKLRNAVSKFCGMYATLEDLEAAVASPSAGNYAYMNDFTYDADTWPEGVTYDPTSIYYNMYAWTADESTGEGSWQVTGITDGSVTAGIGAGGGISDFHDLDEWLVMAATVTGCTGDDGLPSVSAFENKYGKSENADEYFMTVGAIISYVAEKAEALQKTGDSRYLRKDRSDGTGYTLTMGRGVVTGDIDVGGDTHVKGAVYADEISNESSGGTQITINGNVLVGKDGCIQHRDFIPDILSGQKWKVDGDGNSEMESLTLRSFLEVPELRYNRITVESGTTWNAAGAGVIKTIGVYKDADAEVYNATLAAGSSDEEKARHAKMYSFLKNSCVGRPYFDLKLEDGEVGSFVRGDICMGVWHFENQPVDTIEHPYARTDDGSITYDESGNPQGGVNYYGENATAEEEKADASGLTVSGFCRVEFKVTAVVDCYDGDGTFIGGRVFFNYKEGHKGEVQPQMAIVAYGHDLNFDTTDEFGDTVSYDYTARTRSWYATKKFQRYIYNMDGNTACLFRDTYGSYVKYKDLTEAQKVEESEHDSSKLRYFVPAEGGLKADDDNEPYAYFYYKADDWDISFPWNVALHLGDSTGMKVTQKDGSTVNMGDYSVFLSNVYFYGFQQKLDINQLSDSDRLLEKVNLMLDLTSQTNTIHYKAERQGDGTIRNTPVLTNDGGDYIAYTGVKLRNGEEMWTLNEAAAQQSDLSDNEFLMQCTAHNCEYEIEGANVYIRSISDDAYTDGECYVKFSVIPYGCDMTLERYFNVRLVCDGVDGTNATSHIADLTNEMSAVPCDKEYRPTADKTLETVASLSYGTSRIKTKAKCSTSLEGTGLRVMEYYALTYGDAATENELGILESEEHTIHVIATRSTAITPSVDLTLELDSTETDDISRDVKKYVTFTVMAVIPGDDGVTPKIYDLSPSMNSISFTRNDDGTFAEESQNLKVQVRYSEGSSNVIEDIPEGYSVYWSRDARIDAQAESTLYTSSGIDVAPSDSSIYLGLFRGETLIDRETVPVLRDGKRGAGGQGVFTSTLFKRSSSAPGLPTGGSFVYPSPLNTTAYAALTNEEQAAYDEAWNGLDAGWTDDIPSDNTDLPLYMCSRTFTSDAAAPQQSAWQGPNLLADSDSLDVCYHAKTEDGNAPSTEAIESVHGTQNGEGGWHNTGTSDDYWMAVSKKASGVWGAWSVTKIKGEDGNDAVRYDLNLSALTVYKNGKGSVISPAGDLTWKVTKTSGSATTDATTDDVVLWVSTDGGAFAECSLSGSLAHSSLGSLSSLAFELRSVNTSDPSKQGDIVYATATIGSVKDGEDAAGYTADLTNEMSGAACDSSRYPSDASELKTSVSLGYGGSSLLSKIAMSPTAASMLSSYGITVTDSAEADGDDIGTTASTNHDITFAIAKHTSGDGKSPIPSPLEVTMTLTYAGADTTHSGKSSSTTFTIMPVLPGANGDSPIIYQLLPSSNDIKITKSGAYNLSLLSCGITQTAGGITSDVTSSQASDAGLSIYYNVDDAMSGGSLSWKELASGQELAIATSGMGVISPTSRVRLELRQKSTVIDKETIPVVIDGEDGEPGADGTQSNLYGYGCKLEGLAGGASTPVLHTKTGFAMHAIKTSTTNTTANTYMYVNIYYAAKKGVRYAISGTIITPTMGTGFVVGARGTADGWQSSTMKTMPSASGYRFVAWLTPTTDDVYCFVIQVNHSYSTTYSGIFEVTDLKIEDASSLTGTCTPFDGLDREEGIPQGANLIVNSAFDGTDSWTLQYGAAVQTDMYQGLPGIACTFSGSAYARFAKQTLTTLKASTKYTLSWWAKGTGTLMAIVNPQDSVNPNINVVDCKATNIRTDDQVRFHTIALTSEWTYHSLTFVTGSNPGGTGYTPTVEFTATTSDALTYYISMPKLEVGDKPTAWQRNEADKQGENGQSAYEIAGGDSKWGSEATWLASLKGATGIGQAGAMLRSRGFFSDKLTYWNTNSWVDWVMVGTTKWRVSDKVYRIDYNATSGTTTYYLATTADDGTRSQGTFTTRTTLLVPTSSTSGSSITDSANVELWTKFSEVGDYAFHLMLADQADVSDATIGEAFIGKTSAGVTVGADGNLVVDDAANGWLIQAGRIRHTKTGLTLTADGKLYDPDGLSLMVGDGDNYVENLLDSYNYKYDEGAWMVRGLPVGEMSASYRQSEKLASGESYKFTELVPYMWYYVTGITSAALKRADGNGGLSVTKSSEAGYIYAYPKYNTEVAYSKDAVLTNADTACYAFMSACTPASCGLSAILGNRYIIRHTAAKLAAYTNTFDSYSGQIATSVFNGTTNTLDLEAGTYTFTIYVAIHELYVDGADVTGTLADGYIAVDGSVASLGTYFSPSGYLFDGSTPISGCTIAYTGIRKADEWTAVSMTFTLSSAAAFSYRLGMILKGSATRATVCYGGMKLEKTASFTGFAESYPLVSLAKTGIDIRNRKITLTADQLECQNNNGERTMYLDRDGDLQLSGFINEMSLTINADNFSKYLIPAGTVDSNTAQVTWSTYSGLSDKTGTVSLGPSGAQADYSCYLPFINSQVALSVDSSDGDGVFSVDVFKCQGMITLDSSLFADNIVSSTDGQYYYNLLAMPFIMYEGDSKFSVVRTPTSHNSDLDGVSRHLITYEEMRALVGREYIFSNAHSSYAYFIMAFKGDERLEALTVDTSGHDSSGYYRLCYGNLSYSQICIPAGGTVRLKYEVVKNIYTNPSTGGKSELSGIVPVVKDVTPNDGLLATYVKSEASIDSWGEE